MVFFLLQETTSLLSKSKETYKQRSLELEKLRRDSASAKELEKCETKFRKAQEDYKNLVDKYCLIRDEFQRKMSLAAQHFQEIEFTHLTKMREFVETYCQIADDNHNHWGRVRSSRMAGICADSVRWNGCHFRSGTHEFLASCWGFYSARFLPPTSNILAPNQLKQVGRR